MTVLYSNNAASTLASGITSTSTSMTVEAGTGGVFPDPGAGEYFYVTLANDDETTLEIVKVTARTNDVLTIERGFDGTTSSSFSTAAKVELRITKIVLDSKEPADATILKDADIGSSVLAFDTNLQGFVTAFTIPTTDGTSGQALLTNGSGVIAFGDVDALPTQTGNSGKYLTTDGTSPSWDSIVVADISDLTATATELNYTNGVTSAIQTQLDAKVETLSDLSITATATEINYTSGVTSSIQNQLDAKAETLGDLEVTATSTELNYASGVTSAIQTQLDGKEPADATILKDADIGSSVLAYDSNLQGFVTAFTIPTTDGASGQALLTNGAGVIAFGDVDALPAQTGNSGKYLTTDGTSPSWDSIDVADISDLTATATELNYTDGVTSAIQTQLDGKVESLSDLGVTTTSTELNYVDGVTSAIQTQLDAKGTVSTLSDLGITATATELNYVDGVTSDIQTQIDAKGTGSVTSVGGTGTVQGLTLSGTVTSSGNLTLGGSLSDIDLTSQVTGALPIANGGTNLTALGTAGQVLTVNGAGTALEYASVSSGGVTSVDVSGGTSGLTTTGGPITSSGTITIGGTLAVANGGSGATTAAGALSNFGLTATAAELNTLDGITATTVELNYVDGVTSSIQTQLDAKGTVSSLSDLSITATATEINYASGVTSSIQTQLDAKGVGSVTSVGGTGAVNGLTLTGTVTSSGNLTLGGTFSATVSEISDLTATATELNYTDGVTSSIQTQLDSKAFLASPTFTGTVTADGLTVGAVSYPSTDGTAGQVLTTDGSGNVTFADASGGGGGGSYAYVRTNYTATADQTVFSATYTAGYVDVYLNGVKIIVGTDFTALNGTSITLSSGAAVGDLIEIIAFDTFSVADALLAANHLSEVDPATARSNLGVPSASEALLVANDLSDLSSAATARTNLGLVIGTDVQAYDADNTTATNTQSLTNKILANPRFNSGYREDTPPINGSFLAIRTSHGTIQRMNLTGSGTWTDSLVNGESVTIMITDGSGYTITWPTMEWAGGSAPTLATTGYTVVTLWKVNDILYGATVGDMS